MHGVLAEREGDADHRILSSKFRHSQSPTCSLMYEHIGRREEKSGCVAAAIFGALNERYQAGALKNPDKAGQGPRAPALPALRTAELSSEQRDTHAGAC
jgi:hypothetical protein